ncbi:MULTISPECIES: AAA family ATPase [unclassified Paenibacillus]|uniref:AAA family ATPase n=1 Tax=unclassified Paenibacillus TaxID=185978 RepID=UPI0036326579
MIPLRIELTNFRAIAYANIDLTGVTLAAVCGRNGAGKSSTFTLAPIFALFGDKIKGISMDDLVRRGTQEMAVTLEFEHQSSTYKVIRTRSIKGNGKSTLELQQRVSDRWESRSAEKIKDTEDVIRTLLNLDAETFTASSMILQGKANEFTAQTAGKRKEILQQILGLNIYDQLQVKARERASALHHEIERAKQRLADLNERLKAKTDKEDLLKQCNDQLGTTQTTIQGKESELRQQEQLIKELQLKAEKARELRKQIQLLLDEIKTLNAEKLSHTTKLERAEKILVNEVDILAKSEEYLQVKEQIAGLEARQPEQERLLNEIRYVEGAIAKNQQDQLPLIQRIEDIQKLLTNRALLTTKATEYKAASSSLLKMEALADEWDLFEKQIGDTRVKLEAERTRISTTEQLLTAEIKTLENKAGMLEDSNCIDVDKAACRFLGDAQEAKQTLVEKRALLAAMDRSILGQIETNLTDLEKKQQELGYEYTAHRTLKRRVDELQPLAEQAAQLQTKEELLSSIQEQFKHLTDQQQELIGKQERLQVELLTIQEVLSPLLSLQQRVTKLQAWAALKDELAAARVIKNNVDDRVSAIDRELLKKNSHLDETELARSVLTIEIIDLDNEQAKAPAMETELTALREQQNILIGQIGGLKSELAPLEKDEQLRQRLSAELEPKAKQWSRYQTLIRAFGRDGIPALIIENAVPELEVIANDILGQMSKGKHYIRFETQRELKSRDGITETLDIMIGDWTSERPYETFSGGEQLRIDYAIRFALAELLARRAGSKVEWLTIDEGLGSQDGEHRALVLEAIKSVADRFKKVLVITHIEEAQAVFDQLIHVHNELEEAQVKIA